MTVSSTDVRRSYDGDGVTTVFAGPYVVSDDAIKIFSLDSDGVGTTVSTGFTVSNVGVVTGCTVTFDDAPADGTTVVIVRNPPRVQPARFVEGQRFPAATNEQELDRSAMAHQHILDALLRTVRLPQYEASELGPLPDITERATDALNGKIIGFNRAGTQLRVYDNPNVSVDAADLIRSTAIYLASGDYGDCGNADPDEDMAAIEAASAAAEARAADRGLPVFVDGSGRTYYVRATDDLKGYRFNQSTRPWYGGILMRSNVIFRNCTFVPAPMENEPALNTHIEFMFYTPIHEARHTYQNMGFIDCTFDFGSSKFAEVTDYPTYIYAFGVSGVDNFKRINCRFIHSRYDEYEAPEAVANRGRCGFIYNSDDLHIDGDIFDGAGQALICGYIYRANIQNCFVKRFGEGYDFDEPSWNVTFQNMWFEDGVAGGDIECIDYGSGSDWVLRDIHATRTGRIFQVYMKPWGWPTYAEFLAAEGAAIPEADCGDIVTPENVLLDGIYGEETGINFDGTLQATRGSISIGNKRDPDTWTQYGYTNVIGAGFENLVGARNVIIKNVFLKNAMGIQVNECENLQISNVIMENVRCSDSSGDPFQNAALVLRQASTSGTNDNAAVTRVNGVVRDVTILGSEGGGVFVTLPGDLRLDNIKVKGFNLQNSANSNLGISIRQMGRKRGTIEISKLHIEGGLSSSDILLNMSALDPVTEEFRVGKRGVWNLVPTNGASYFTSSDRVGDRWDMSYEMHKVTNYDTTNATGSAIQEYQVGAVAANYRAFLGGALEATSAITAQGTTNCTRFGVRKITSTDTGGTDLTSLGNVIVDDVAHDARTVQRLSGANFLNVDVLVPGDVWLIAFKQKDGGTGSKYTGVLFATLYYFEFVSTPEA